MSYLLIPDMRVQTANIHHSSFLLGGPPVMAAFFFAHAMGRQLGKNVRVNGTAYIHHHMDVLGQSFYGRLSLQQRRGAAFTFSNKPKKERCRPSILMADTPSFFSLGRSSSVFKLAGSSMA